MAYCTEAPSQANLDNRLRFQSQPHANLDREKQVTLEMVIAIAEVRLKLRPSYTALILLRNYVDPALDANPAMELSKTTHWPASHPILLSLIRAPTPSTIRTDATTTAHSCMPVTLTLYGVCVAAHTVASITSNVT